jgi:hypothetical protein
MTALFAIISVVLFVASTALLFRSFRNYDELAWYWPDDTCAGVESAKGRFSMDVYVSTDPATSHHLADCDFWWEHRRGGWVINLKRANDSFGVSILGFEAGGWHDNRGRGGSMRLVVVPIWFLMLVTGLPPACWFYRIRKNARGAYRRRLGLCPRCGYDVRASPQRCSECGTELRERADSRENPI